MENAKDVALATVKGTVSLIPLAGGFLSEYIGLANEKIMAKRLEDWMNLVDERLSKLESDLSEIATDEFFFTCVQTTTVGALRAYQSEKRRIFADALFNAFTLMDISEEKKSIFISLIDRYTLISIILLNYYSRNNFSLVRAKTTEGSRSLYAVFTSPEAESPFNGIMEFIPELAKEKELAQAITSQLAADGLIVPVKWDFLEFPEQARRKRTTVLGDEFVRFIATKPD